MARPSPPTVVLDPWGDGSGRRDVFDTLLQANDGIPAPHVADRLTGAAGQTDVDCGSRSPISSHGFWITVHTVACQLSHEGTAQDSIVDIIKEIKERSCVRTDVGGYTMCEWQHQRVLEAAFSEVYDVCNPSDWPPFVSETTCSWRTRLSHQKVSWTSVPDISADDEAALRLSCHSYAARLTQAGLLTNDKYCVFAFADALEGQYSDEKLPESVADPTVLRDSAIRIRIVTQWIQHAAYAIRHKGGSIWGEIHGPLVTWDEKGFSEHRWQLWKSRLSLVEMNPMLDDDTRVRAGQAVVKMNEVESGQGGGLT
ncbi:hypothetical protein KEM52_001352 [Ascosphaera acerosa]|nr:hypothetical protein KEM52_001352 [Ascosphaera acerosa]